MGRVGTWLAAHQLPIEPDIVTSARASAPGHAPLGAALCSQDVYDAIDQRVARVRPGHTWDGAPLSSAVGLAVLDMLVERGLVDRVRDAGRRSATSSRPRSPDRHRPRGAGPRVPARGRAGRPAGRDVVPTRRAGRGDPRGPDRVGARAAGHVDPLDVGRLCGRPDAPRSGVRRHATRNSPRWSSGSPRRSATSRRAVQASPAHEHGHVAEFVLLGIPDVNGSIRGKALRPAAFERAVRDGTVMTDLILGLDPVDTPIGDYERFGIRTGAADLIVHPDPETLHPLAGGRAGRSAWRRRAGRTGRRASSRPGRSSAASLDAHARSVRSAVRARVRGPAPRRAPARRSRAGSATAWPRSGGTTRSSTRSVPALEDLGSSSRPSTRRPAPACSS